MRRRRGLLQDPPRAREHRRRDGRVRAPLCHHGRPGRGQEARRQEVPGDSPVQKRGATDLQGRLVRRGRGSSLADRRREFGDCREDRVGEREDLEQAAGD